MVREYGPALGRRRWKGIKQYRRPHADETYSRNAYKQGYNANNDNCYEDAGRDTETLGKAFHIEPPGCRW